MDRRIMVSRLDSMEDSIRNYNIFEIMEIFNKMKKLKKIIRCIPFEYQGIAPDAWYAMDLKQPPRHEEIHRSEVGGLWYYVTCSPLQIQR
ncbi:hypothetical protein AVEN_128284-1 [Araneus ventricosus]|uniref:Uncharacterized protein n=1 Tax=Araneus ventricosus TaxID=182803 RepID=A0A4Y2TY48_ARAVE|nr:hypothetical protein AVEN_128284-1 [Araneus ventricosus]